MIKKVMATSVNIASVHASRDGSAKKFTKKSLGVMINEVHPCISFKQLCFYMKICRDGPH